MAKEYVVGFLFDAPKEFVVMIQKNRPAWQAGFLNGPGGSIEPGETPEQAMQREFQEEAGVTISNWLAFAKLETDNVVVHFFTAHRNANLPNPSPTDEEVSWYNIYGITGADLPVLENIKFLVPMALYALANRPKLGFRVVMKETENFAKATPST